MTRHRRAWLVPLLAALFGAAPARAQDAYDQTPIHGLLRGAERFFHAAVTQGCPGFVMRGEEAFEGVVPDSTPLEKRCRADTSFVYPAADGARWLAVRYERFYVFAADPVHRASRQATRDTAVLLTTVLYSAPADSDRWRAEWNGMADRAMLWSITPSVGRRPDGSALVSVRYCVNGTGGCGQEYLRRDRGRWHAVEAAFWKELRAATTDQVGKGPGVDVQTLTGSYGVYREHDANCCPSHEIVFSLVQRGDTLLLKSATVRPSPP